MAAPAFAEILEELVNRDPRADVDPDGRLVEGEQPDVAGQAPGQQNLLLVAAGEVIDLALDAWRLQVQAPGEFLHAGRSAAR